jgi:hypothetical protein
MAFSNSRISTFKRCRLKYHWSYAEKQVQVPSSALRRGSAAHLAMATYYRGEDPETAIADAWSEFNPGPPDTLVAMEKLDAVLDRYFRWAAFNDGWKVLEVEKTVEVEYAGEKLMGIWDLLVRKNGVTFIVDHKFQKSHSMAHLDVDSQVTHYLALARLAGVEARGMLYNIINLEVGSKRLPAIREFTTRTDSFLDAYLASLLPVIQEVRSADQGELPIYANWTRDCCWDCGFYRRCIDTPYKEGKFDATASTTRSNGTGR